MTLVRRRAPPTAAQRQLGESERTRLERRLARQIELAGLPTPETQYLWARDVGRMFRSDFAYPEEPFKILIEVQGGIWAKDAGRHNRGSGFEAECSRSNLAVLLGYRLLMFTERMIGTVPGKGEAVDTITAALFGGDISHSSSLQSKARSSGAANALDRVNKET